MKRKPLLSWKEKLYSQRSTNSSSRNKILTLGNFYSHGKATSTLMERKFLLSQQIQTLLSRNDISILKKRFDQRKNDSIFKEIQTLLSQKYAMCTKFYVHNVCRGCV